MKHDFIDKYSDSDSFLHRLDPRVKVLSVTAAIIAIVSEPRGDLSAFPVYFALIIVLTVISNLPTVFILTRCLQASPFIIAAAVFYPVSFMLGGGGSLNRPLSAGGAGAIAAVTASILLKAYAAVILLTVLISTTGFHRMLWAMRRLKAPKSVCVVSGLMYRYIFLLIDELHRTNRARESRTPGRLRVGPFRVYGNQAAVIFIRGWERAEKVYAAMISRGFTGDFPEGSAGRLRTVYIVYAVIIMLPFIITRVFI
jgi:cobalt/nickel transport system permease protein